MDKLNIHIKENSWIARMAAWNLHAKNMAIVIGNTIHLHNTAKKDFLQNEKWLKHEMCHVQQFQRYGFFNFILKYLVESILRGYTNNRFEIEARIAENS